MKIGLLGNGTVGSGVIEILDSGVKQLAIQQILVKKLTFDADPRSTDDYQKILDDKEITCVVEVIGGLHPAREYILKALKAGKHVVTANKAVIAAYLPEFMETAQKNHVEFRFEASVGGGIPWLDNLLRVKRIDEISEISGIFNGTTNFILDLLHKSQRDFIEILAEAQRLGYAEADPSADIDGFDIQNKCLITSALAYNSYFKLQDIPVYGIRSISQADIIYFKQQGWICKLMAHSINYGNTIAAYVEPVCLNETALEANVEANFNLACLKGQTIGDLKFYGQGAGKLATAHAVVQDCLDIENKQALLNPIRIQGFKAIDNTHERHAYYIRIPASSDLFDMIHEMSVSYEKDETSIFFITKQISVAQMHQLFSQWKDKEFFFAAIQN